MDNKDTITYYQKVVRVGDQNWEIVQITTRIIRFLFGDSHSPYFIQGVF